ncbi:hypothetical protein PSSHI_34080 [Photobacterium sp. R1]
MEQILTGNQMELTRIQTVNTDIDLRQAGLSPFMNMLCHPVSIGGGCHLLDTGLRSNCMDDVCEITSQAGFSPSEPDLGCPAVSKCLGHSTDFIQSQE